MKKVKFSKLSLSDKLLLLTGYLLLGLFVIAIIIPIIYIVIASFMEQCDHLFRRIYGRIRRRNTARCISDVQD